MANKSSTTRIKRLRAWMLVFLNVSEVPVNEIKRDDWIVPDHQLMTKALMRLKPKKYSFQLERGKLKGNLHYQIFVVLEDPMSGREIRESMKSILRDHWKASCLTYQPLHSQSDAEIYCQKVDTRVDGPWHFPKDRYIGQDLYHPRSYYPWQRSILAIAKRKTIDQRAIYLIVDEIGNSGKSEVCKYMAYSLNAIVLPLGLTSAQMKAAINSIEPNKNYIIDLPRNNKSYRDIFDTIEEIKRGFVCSCFHGKYVKNFFTRPNVFIFTNSMPDIRLMSHDMWRPYKIDPVTKKLVALDVLEILNHQTRIREAKEAKDNVDRALNGLKNRAPGRKFWDGRNLWDDDVPF